MNASARQKSLPVATADAGDDAARRACRAPGRRGRRAPRRARCRRASAAPTAAPRNGMNIGALGLDALAAQLDHVAHLVDEQQRDEADRERPAPDQRVGGDRDEHRARGRQELELRQQQQRDLAELGQQRRRRPRSGRAGAGRATCAAPRTAAGRRGLGRAPAGGRRQPGFGLRSIARFSVAARDLRLGFPRSDAGYRIGAPCVSQGGCLGSLQTRRSQPQRARPEDERPAALKDRKLRRIGRRAPRAAPFASLFV